MSLSCKPNHYLAVYCLVEQSANTEGSGQARGPGVACPCKENEMNFLLILFVLHYETRYCGERPVFL